MNDKISTFFYFGLQISELTKPDPAYIEEMKKEQKEDNNTQTLPQNVFQPYGEIDGNFEDEEDELKKAIEASLNISEP